MKVNEVRELIGRSGATLGQQVRTRREELGLSQAALADLVRELGFPWHQTAVAKTEAGQRPLKYGEAVALAFALELPSLEALLEGSPLPTALRQHFAEREAARRARLIAAMRSNLERMARAGGADAEALLDRFDADMAQVEAGLQMVAPGARATDAGSLLEELDAHAFNAAAFADPDAAEDRARMLAELRKAGEEAPRG